MASVFKILAVTAIIIGAIFIIISGLESFRPEGAMSIQIMLSELTTIGWSLLSIGLLLSFASNQVKAIKRANRLDRKEVEYARKETIARQQLKKELQVSAMFKTLNNM